MIKNIIVCILLIILLVLAQVFANTFKVINYKSKIEEINRVEFNQINK